MQNIPTGHPVAEDPSQKMAVAAMNSDPAQALQNLILEKQRLQTALAQQEGLSDELRQANVRLEKEMERFAPYMDIINDPRTYLPVYVRDKILIKALQMKAKDRWNKLADLNSESEAGRKLAHRYMDSMIEVALRHRLKIWHQIDAQLQEAEPHANKV